MKCIFAAALLVSLITFSSAFAQEGPSGASVADREWRSLVEPLLPLGERTAALVSDPQDPLLRQEMYKQLFMSMSAAYLGLFVGDAAHPDFWPVFNQAYPLGSANPDDAYYLATLGGDGVYKISGYRGTVRTIDFQIGIGGWYAGDNHFAPALANYDIDTLHINKKDGSFEVVLSAERPAGYQGDWWKLDPRATYVMVRQISYDWLHEIDGRLAIERLDRAATKPRLSAQEIEANLRRISSWAENWTVLPLERIIKNHRDGGMVNKLNVVDFSGVGGFTIQKYIDGLFEVDADEALIYETELPKHCRYWNIVVNDMLMDTIDYANRQSSLNGYTARLDKDGKFRAVISATDPGVPNWLDSAGYKQGTVFGRWKQCSSYPTPTLTRIKLADVRKYLPADTPVVKAEAREAAIRLRRKGAQLRRRW